MGAFREGDRPGREHAEAGPVDDHLDRRIVRGGEGHRPVLDPEIDLWLIVGFVDPGDRQGDDSCALRGKGIVEPFRSVVGVCMIG